MQIGARLMGVLFNKDEVRTDCTENSIKENHIAREEQANSITQAQLDRAQSIQQQKVIHIIKIALFTIVPFSLVMIMLVYFLHMVLPDTWRWLTKNELMELKDIAMPIIVGVVSTFICNYLFKK